MTNNRHVGPVKVEYFRNSAANREMDFDNLVSSTKLIFDAIVKAGVLVDDSPKIIQELSHKHILLSRKINPFTVIIITDL